MYVPQFYSQGDFNLAATNPLIRGYFNGCGDKSVELCHVGTIPQPCWFDSKGSCRATPGHLNEPATRRAGILVESSGDQTRPECNSVLNKITVLSEMLQCREHLRFGGFEAVKGVKDEES